MKQKSEPVQVFTAGEKCLLRGNLFRDSNFDQVDFSSADLRDTMFEAEETSTRMSDVMIAVQKLVLKIEATMRPPNDAA